MWIKYKIDGKNEMLNMALVERVDLCELRNGEATVTATTNSCIYEIFRGNGDEAQAKYEAVQMALCCNNQWVQEILTAEDLADEDF